MLNAKKNAGEYVASLVKSGMSVGLGTGTTARFAIAALGARTRAEGIRVKAIATSLASEQQAIAEGIALTTFEKVSVLDLAFDGADEVDAAWNLTKGGGGALLREKIVAANCEIFYCIIDEAKKVDTLHSFPLPIEVVPYGRFSVERELVRLGASVTLRRQSPTSNEIYVTDNGLWILDARFPPIMEPARLALALSLIPGVAEHGLFCNMVDVLVVGTDTGVSVVRAADRAAASSTS
jgi:ribose 5-phosphate isomerase A